MPKYLDLEGLKYYDQKLKDSVYTAIVEEEEVISAALNDLNSRIENMVVEETDPTVPSWAKQETKPSYTASEVGAVPTSRTVNGKSLSSDITLTAADVNALPASTVIPSKLSDLTNDAGYITSSDLTDEVSQEDKPVTANAVYEYITEDEKVIASALNDLNERIGDVETTVSDNEVVTAAALNDLNSNKQNKLVSGTNIKTINNQSLLGEGNITISGGGEGIKKEILTRAEYTALANNNALDEDTLYLVLEAQSEIANDVDESTIQYNDIRISKIQPSGSSGGGSSPLE